MSDIVWPGGRRCAVSLTYDDGLASHHEHVAPTLERYGLRGTFFADIRSDVLLNPDAWRALAQAGHEIGNHTIFHPCRFDKPISWLDDGFNMCDYTVGRMREELMIANRVLKLIDGRDDRTYAATCGCDTVGRGEQQVSIRPLFEELFVAARVKGTNGLAEIGAGADYWNIGCISGHDTTLERMIDFAEKAAAHGGWAVFMMHGVGEGTHGMVTDADVHERFASWLSAHAETVWTAPFRDVAVHLRHSDR
jgi:sialate O-acetylesterase